MRKLFILGLILIIPTFASLMRPGLHNMQDGMQYFRIFEMSNCLTDGQIPCRWVPNLGFGYGYPLYIYYPPGPYYIGSLLHLLGIQFIDAVKILFVVGFVFSYWAMFIFLNEWLSNRYASFIGAILYIYVPVRMVQVYVRGSLSEFLAFIFFPLIFFFSLKIRDNGSKRNISFLALSVAGLLLTHNLMSLIFFPIWGTWILFQRSNYLKVFVAVCLGIGLASFFVISMIVERPYAHLETLTGGYFGYQQHFVSLKQLFLSNNFGYGSSQLGPSDDMSLSIGYIHWILAVGAIIFAIKSRYISVIIVVLIEIGVLFLMHERSSFVWSRLTILSWLQFPWRLLVISSFQLSMLSAYFISKFKYSKWLLIVIILLSLVTVGRFFTPEQWIPVTDSQLLSGVDFERQLTTSIFDYLPIYAVLPPNRKAAEGPEILAGRAVISKYQKRSNSQNGQISVSSLSTQLRLPIFDFPGMTTYIDRKLVSHQHDQCQGEDYCFGLVTLEIPTGVHELEVKLEKQPDQWIGDSISILSLIIVGIFLL